MKKSSEQISIPEDTGDVTDSSALDSPAYEHLKAEDPATHRVLARGLERFGSAEILERIRQENFPEGMRNFEIRLREACVNLHRQIERHGADADNSLRDLDRDFGKLLEDVTVLRELVEGLHDGTAERLGWDKGMVAAAVANIQEEIPVLANRLQSFHFPTRGERVWSAIKEHLGKELMALGMAVGVMMSMPSLLSVPEDTRVEQGQEAPEFKQPGESPSGQEKLPGGNLLTDQPAPGDPGMGNAGEKPGEFERRKELAKISGGLGSFFITQAYKFDQKGNRVFVPRSEAGFHSRTPNGFIDMAPVQYQRGQTLRIPVPLAYDVVSAEVKDGDIRIKGNGITFGKETEGPVAIRVGVASSVDNTYRLETVAASGFPDVQELNELRSRIGSPEGKGREQKLFASYTRRFTYIVSSDLQKLMSEIPGSMPEKTTLLPYGDCDVISDHLAYNLRDKLPVGVGMGYLDRGRKGVLSEGIEHARLMYESAGKLEEFESTAAVRQKFVNLSFSPEDYQRLAGIVERIKAAKNPAEQKDGMRAFREYLDQALQKPEYKKFVPRRSMADAIGEFSGNLKDLFNIDWEETLIPKNPFVGIGLAALIEALGIAGFAWGGRKAIQAHTRRTREKDFREDVARMEEAGILEVNPDAKNRAVEAEFHEACRVLGANPAIATRLSLEEKEVLLMLQSLRDEAMSHWIPYALTSGRFKAERFQDSLIELSQASGTDPEDAREALKKFFDSKKFRAEAEQEKGHTVDRVWKRGNSFLSELARHGKKSDVYDLLGTESHGRLSHAAHGRKKTRGGDFDESREYQAGDDIRHMDWKASGRRDKYLVKEFRSPEGGMRAQENFRLVIDVPSVSNYELEGLVSFFMLARKNKNIHMQEMDLYAFGKPIRRFDARMLQKITDTATGIEGLRKLIEIVVGERTNHAIFLASGGTSWYENINMLSGTFLSDELRKSKDRDVSTVFLGVAKSSEYSEGWLRIIGFA